MTDTTIFSPTLARAKLPELERHIGAAADALLADQRADGHWVFELEADATIPAEYARSASTCAASRASTAAGRCSTRASST
jgi:hypothetical protein